MSATHAVQARARWAPATPAPPRLARRVHAGPVPAPVSSLSAIPAAPSVQPKCAECKAEDKSPVQPRLEVGPVGDRYEAEADAIAGQVMAMRDADVSAAAPAIQRKCASCDSEQTVRRQADVTSEVEEEEAQPRRQIDATEADEEEARPRRQVDATEADEEEAQARRAPGDGDSLGASAAELTRGGTPLPDVTRRFFEPRMGRDLSGVRVHEGGEASPLNKSIRARAFTYSNHVWLGVGERAAPGFTMAHELAHVLQQTQPGPVSARSEIVTEAAAAPSRVMRRNLRAFWLPLNATAPAKTIHGNMHDKAVEAIGAMSPDLIQEAPIPGANKSTIACGKHGFADLFFADSGRTIGIEEECNPVPGTGQLPVHDFLRSTGPAGPRANWRGQMKGTSPFTHSSQRAPKINSATNTIDLAGAPSTVRVGEMKPGHNEDERSKGVTQIGNYGAGIRGVVSAANTALPAGGQWSINSAQSMRLKKSDVTIPDGWDPQKTPTRGEMKLKLRYQGKDFVPWGTGGTTHSMPVLGRWVIARDTKHRGIWTYFLLPNQASLNAALKRKTNKTELRTFGSRLQVEVLNPLLTTPGTKKARKLPAPSLPGTVGARPAPRRIQAKKVEDTSFDYAVWNKNRVGKKTDPTSLTRSFKGRFEKRIPDKERETINFQAGALEAIDALEADYEGVSLNKPINALDIKTAGGTLDKVEFWTSTPAGFIGRLRDLLGDFFVRIALTVQNLKDKAQKKFKQFKFKGRASGIKAAAMKAGAVVLKTLGRMVMTRTIAALTRCLQDGFRNTMKKFVEGSGLDDLNKKAEEVKTFMTTMKEEAFNDVDAFAEQVIGPFRTKIEAFADDIETIGRLAGAVSKIAHGARIALCLLGGLESMGLACVVAIVDFLLSLFGVSPTDYIVGRLLNSCEAKRAIAGALVVSDTIRNIPNVIAKELVKRVRAALPEQLSGLLCDPDTIDVKMPNPDDIPCSEFEDSGGDGGGGGDGAAGVGGRAPDGDGGGPRKADGGDGDGGVGGGGDGEPAKPDQAAKSGDGGGDSAGDSGAVLDAGVQPRVAQGPTQLKNTEKSNEDINGNQVTTKIRVHAGVDPKNLEVSKGRHPVHLSVQSAKYIYGPVPHTIDIIGIKKVETRHEVSFTLKERLTLTGEYETTQAGVTRKRKVRIMLSPGTRNGVLWKQVSP